MSKSLTVTTPEPLALTTAAQHYARSSKSDRTLKLYAAAWREFETYARQHQRPAAPADPSLVINYLSDLAEGGAAFASIAVKRAAIVYVHRLKHLPDPTALEDVTAVMSGIAREIGTAQHGKDPLTFKELKRLTRVIPGDLRGRRDRALLLLGYAGAFRRSELVALNVKDLAITDALRVTIRKSKTDQARAGLIKVIPLDMPAAIDPVTALTEYLDEADITSGPIFRRFTRWGLQPERLSAQSVNLILKHYAAAAGLDPDRLGAHSLRAGFVTTAYVNGSQIAEIIEVTGHKATSSTIYQYIRLAGRGAQAAVRSAFREANHE